MSKHTFKNKNKTKSLTRIFVYHFFLFYICLFVAVNIIIIETRSYDIAHDENAMSSSISQSI